MEEEREIRWKSIVWSAILIFVISLVAQFAIGSIYPTYVGFQTRGDPDAINEAIKVASTSLVLLVSVYVVYGLVAFWRGSALARKAEYRPDVHALAAGGLAALLEAILGFVARNDVVTILILVVVIVGGAYLGAMLGSRKAQS